MEKHYDMLGRLSPRKQVMRDPNWEIFDGGIDVLIKHVIWQVKHPVIDILQIHFTWMKVIGFHCCTNENDYIYSLRYCNIDKIPNNTMNHLYKYAIQWTILEYYHPSVGLILCHSDNWWSNTNLQMFFVQKSQSIQTSH